MCNSEFRQMLVSPSMSKNQVSELNAALTLQFSNTKFQLFTLMSKWFKNKDSPTVDMCLYWYKTNTHSTVFDEGVTELCDFGSGHGDLLQEKFPSLFHHLLTARQVLTKSRRLIPGSSLSSLLTAKSPKPRTWCSSDVRLMKRRKSSPPEDTATEESTPVRQAVAHFRLSLRPWIVSPEGANKINSCFQEYIRLKLKNTPLSLLRNSSKVRMAATADAMPGSLFICALKYSTSSVHGHTEIPLMSTVPAKKT